MEDLIALKGIGTKSANVFMHEVKVRKEEIIADLHVIKVADRVALIQEIKSDKQLVQVLLREIWGEMRRAISFLRREICQPPP